MLELLSFGDQGWGDEMLLAGLMTILVSFSSVCLGLFIGVILASFKLSKSRILRFIAEIYTTVVRGVPELLVIYLLFFWTFIPAIIAFIEGIIYLTSPNDHVFTKRYCQ